MQGEVAVMFEMVAVGDAVELYSERTPELERIFGPVLMAHAGAAEGE